MEPPRVIGQSVGTPAAIPANTPHIHCYNPAFCGQEGVHPLLGGMLQPIYLPGPRLPRPFPVQSTRCPHAPSFLVIFTGATARYFSTTNYITRTEYREWTRLMAPMSEPCSELKMRLWRDNSVIPPRLHDIGDTCNVTVRSAVNACLFKQYQFHLIGTSVWSSVCFCVFHQII